MAAGNANKITKQVTFSTDKHTPIREEPPRTARKEAAAWVVPENYRLMQTLGKGAYGVVREGFDNTKNRRVAVKRVGHIFRDVQCCKRILREICLLGMLRHENIVELMDVFAPDDKFKEVYLVMELCDNDVRQLLQEDVSLSPRQIRRLLYNLLLGLNYLHSAGVYHRDLKPANCLVNQDCSLKICDFGLARAMGSRDKASGDVESDHPDVPQSEQAPRPGKVLTGHVVTRWYRAPELILMAETYNGAIDMWSVGCIYAELLGMMAEVKVKDRRALFPGSSCFPLSPAEPERSRYLSQREPRVNPKGDQLTAIFHVLGVPTDDDLAVMGTEAQRYYRNYVREAGMCRGKGLEAVIPWMDSDSHRFLKHSLLFNPKKRLSVEGALKQPVLAPVVESGRRKLAPRVLNFKFEKDAELDEKRLRGYFQAEFAKYST